MALEFGGLDVCVDAKGVFDGDRGVDILVDPPSGGKRFGYFLPTAKARAFAHRILEKVSIAEDGKK
jgi:hypothetical protein